MRKFRWLLLIAALAAMLVLCVSCDEAAEPPVETEAPETETEETEEPEKYLEIAKDGVINCNVIYPKNGTSYEMVNAELLRDELKSLSGVEPKFRADVGAYDETTLEIYVGSTAYKESTDALANVGYGEYIVTKIGNKIIINAVESEAFREGINAFIALMKENSKDNTVLVPETFEIKKDVAPVLSAIPKIEGKVPLGYCVRSGQAYTAAVQKATKNTFTTYLKALEAAGYKKYAENTIGTDEENLFATYHNDDNIINVSFFNASKSMSIAIESKAFSDLPVKEAAYSGEHKTKMYLLGVSNSTFENGMSFVIHLSDGRFIVYDGGGANGETDSKNLYNNLKKWAGSDNVTIAAWVITHCHGDHATCFNTFMKSSYISDKLVTVENVIFSPSAYSYGTASSEGSSAEANIVVNTMIKTPKANLIVAHAGQEFVFADLRMEILFTLDNMMPFDFNADKADMYNAASIVSKLYVKDSAGNEKSVLMTGDAYIDCVKFMCKNYGAYLKSHYLQVPHHGASNGGTVEFYDLVDPDILIWPAGNTLFTQTTQGNRFNSQTANLHLLEKVGETKTNGVYDPDTLKYTYVAKVGSVKEMPLG